MHPHEKLTRLLMNGPFLHESPGMQRILLAGDFAQMWQGMRGEANRKLFRVCGIVKEGKYLVTRILTGGSALFWAG